MKTDNILQTIGNTPHVRINRVFGPGANVWIKSERSNPGGSIKDRIANAMVEDAEKSGALKPGGTIIEPTSGNTGIGLALVAAVKGYKLILVMPDSMSIERRRLMLAYGASFDLTPREKGMKGSIARAEEIVAATPGADFDRTRGHEWLRFSFAGTTPDMAEAMDRLAAQLLRAANVTVLDPALDWSWKARE